MAMPSSLRYFLKFSSQQPFRTFLPELYAANFVRELTSSQI